MDREQEELQFLGFFGIFKESTNILQTWRRIFLNITLTLILPLTAIFIAHSALTDLLGASIERNEDILDKTRVGSTLYDRMSNTLSWEWTEYWLIQAGYFTFLLILSLLSTSAVVYTVACAYSGKYGISFRKVMTVVPKVWKRLMVTFLWNFVVLVVYNIAVLFCLMVSLMIFYDRGEDAFRTIFMVFAAVYFIGFVYISVVWQMASVVSVLEDRYGMEAMRKSRALLRGKMVVAVMVFLVVNMCLGAIQAWFEGVVIVDRSTSVGAVAKKVGCGAVSFLLLSALFLFGLVVQTVVYFVCKSYHHESIDRSALSDHLEAYLGEYVPLTAKELQMEPI